MRALDRTPRPFRNPAVAVGIALALLLAGRPVVAAKAKMYPGPERPKSELGILSCPMGSLKITQVDGQPLPLQGFSARFQRSGCGGVGNKIHLLPGPHSLTLFLMSELERGADGLDYGWAKWATVEFGVEPGRQYKVVTGAAVGPATWSYRLSRMRMGAGGGFELLADRIVTPRPGETTFVVIDKSDKRRVGQAVEAAEWLRGAAAVSRATHESPNRARAAAIESEYTGQRQPTLLIENLFPRRQFIFLGDTYLGTVEVSGSRKFDVPVGEQLLIAADSLDPTDNAASEEASFETGYSYTYQIRRTP